MYFKQGTMTVVHSFGSTIGHTNFMAGYLAMVFAVLVAVWLSAPTPRRWWAGAGCALVAVVLGRARSAGSLLGLMAAALFALGPVWSTVRSRRMQVGFVAAVLVAVAAAGGIAVGKLTGIPHPIEVRHATSRIGLVAVSERPFFGFGAHGYSRESVRIERMLFGHLWFHPEGEPLSAHNAFLDLAVERGVPALGAFLGVLAAVLTAGVQGYRRSGDRAHRIMIAGLTAGLLAFIVQALTENLFGFSKVAGIFWILAAVLVHAVNAPGPRPSIGAPRPV
jgi:O-antigen ligase